VGEVITTAVAELGVEVDSGVLEPVPVPAVTLPAVPVPAAALPELELAPGVEEALPVVEPAEELLPPVEEPPLTRAGVVKVPAEFFSPPDPPQPAIAATKTIDKNESTLCRIQPPLAVTGAVSRSSPSKGNYGCIYSGDIRGIP